MSLKTITAGSWKTTSLGITTIAGAIIHLIFDVRSNGWNEADVMTAVITLLPGVGLILARDNDKSSEQVGAGTTNGVTK
jgi:hypothetical protein